MMENLNSEQASILAQTFLNLSKTVTDFKLDNWYLLSEENKSQLEKLQQSFYTQGEEMLARSTMLMLEDVTDSFEKIQVVIGEIQVTLKKIKNIDQGINMIASLITLGDAIVHCDLKTIPDTLFKITNSYKSMIHS